MSILQKHRILVGYEKVLGCVLMITKVLYMHINLLVISNNASSHSHRLIGDSPHMKDCCTMEMGYLSIVLALRIIINA